MNLNHYYTGARVLPFAPPVHAYYPQAPQGFCRSCGHPSAQCGCGCRTCRKEAKELVVDPDSKRAAAGLSAFTSLGNVFVERGTTSLAGDTSATADRLARAATEAIGRDSAFIGGGCCVHISVEYMPASPTADSMVAIIARDSKETLLAWEKTEKAGTHYTVNENVITTNPGATIMLIVRNMVARARWCECFSC